MKKIYTILLLVSVLLLSGCVVDDVSTDKDKTPDNTETPVEETRTAAPTVIKNAVEVVVDEEYSYYEHSSAVSGTNIVKVYVGEDNDQKPQMYVYRINVMGRWDTIDYIVVFDKTNNNIAGLQIISHDENWGSYIENYSFWGQFIDQDIQYYLNNDLEMGVDGNASATTTYRVMTETLRDAINHYLNNIE